MKKITSVITAAVMLLSTAPLTAYAADGPLPVDPDWMPAWGFATVSVYNMETQEEKPIYNAGTIDNNAVEGASYDLASNTLTLRNVKIPGSSLSVHMMGDDFKIKAEGECELGVIYVNDYEYSTTLTITGTGVLNLNKDLNYGYAVSFYGGEEQKSLNIDKSVTVNMYSPENSKTIFKTFACKNADPKAVFNVDGKGVEGMTCKEQVRTEYDWVNAAKRNFTDTSSYYHGSRVISKEDPDGIYAAYSYLNSPDTFYVSRYKYYEEFDIYATDLDFGSDGNTTVAMPREEFEAQYSYAEPRESYYTFSSFYRGEMEIYYDDNGKKYLADYNGNAYEYDENEIIMLGGEPYYVARPAENIKLSDLNDTKTYIKTGLYDYMLEGTEFTCKGEGGEAPALKPGDVDGNGKVDISDATAIQLYLAEMANLTDEQLAAADVNNDGKTDISDATQIQLFLAEIIDSLTA